MDEEDLTALLRRHALTHSVPGAAIGVLREGTTATACYGAADITTGEPVTPETGFSAGSLTKSMVATVIARLAEAGRLSLDDLVAAHVPELRTSGWAGRATLRELLANRSGLALRAGLEFGFADRNDKDDGALSRLVADAAAGGRAGEFWSYTNVGWFVLGRVIETAAGTGWEQAMRRHLFDRAGMSGTAFVTDGVPERRAMGHRVTSDGAVPVAPLIARAYGPAGTSAITTVTDLLRFAAVHLEDPSLASLRVVHAEVSIYGWLDSWCLGWARFDWDGGQVWGWDGLVNGERFAGVYAWPDRRVSVTAISDGLLIDGEDGQAEALPLNERTFVTDPADPDNPAVTFGAFDAAGRPRVLYDMLWGLPRLGG